MGKEVFRIGLLDDLAEVHDGDTVTDVPDDGQIMGDEQICKPELTLEVGKQVEDLCLDRHVKGTDRFVTDHEFRAQGERAGYPDPLPLSSAKGMGEAAQMFNV